MKIILTGSLGNISKPLAQKLVRKGHAVTVISSNADKQTAIEALGATAAIGSIEDVAFLTDTFTGADAVYCMIPFNFTEPDQVGYMARTGNNYLQATQQAGVKRVVNLSGWAAHLLSTPNPEEGFNALPNVAVTHMRPGYFYSNFYGMMDMIRGKGLMGTFMTLRFNGLMALLTGKRGMIAANFGGEDKIALVSPIDIADAVAEELETPFTVKKIRYVASEEMTCNEAARVIGTAVGKPRLKWATMSEKQMKMGLEAFKMPKQLVAGIVEMQSVIHSGKVLKDFYANKPVFGKVKLSDFAKEFAVAYNKK